MQVLIRHKAAGAPRIPWGDLTADTYLYGSVLRAGAAGDVYFENRLLAPGKAVKTWRSRSSYSAQRRQPDLPPLTPGGTYRLCAHVAADAAGSLLFRLAFTDSGGGPAGERLLFAEAKAQEEGRRCAAVGPQAARLWRTQAFAVPAGAAHYTLSLLENGYTQLWFDWLCLEAAEA